MDRFNLGLLLKKLVTYLLEGGAVALAAFYIPRRKLDLQEIAIIALTAAAVFALLDLFAPSIGSGARQGAGFGIGLNLAGFPMVGGGNQTGGFVKGVKVDTDADGVHIHVQHPQQLVSQFGSMKLADVADNIKAQVDNVANMVKQSPFSNQSVSQFATMVSEQYCAAQAAQPAAQPAQPAQPAAQPVAQPAATGAVKA